jgi:glycosyltransferase involved in cell wall biosynthesis
VTIGMPVYNGEPHIGRAIKSILAQTYTDFCLIIVDNASTDHTAEIVCEFARHDQRVEYHRNTCNIGAGPNFNKTFKLSRSPYFKWAAHDDELLPRYIETCVKALDAHPSAVLAHSYVQEVDDSGAILRIYRPVDDAAALPIRSLRFKSRVMQRGSCTEIFGLIRAEQLAGSMMLSSFAGSDLSLITELCLRGQFIIVPEPLFVHRAHSERYSTAVLSEISSYSRLRRIMAWWDTSKKAKRWQMHWWILFFAYFRMINRNIDGWSQRALYYLIALRWLTVRNNRVDLAKDLICAISPGLLDRLIRLKQYLETRNPRTV